MVDALPPRLALPAPAADPPRQAFPLAALVVPVLGAGAMWLITGSTMALWFAALGPLLAMASLIDTGRGRRRHRRRERRDRAVRVRELRTEILRIHEEERLAAEIATPTVVGYATSPDEVWRSVPGRGETLTVGRSDRPSAVVLDGAIAADTVDLARAARTLTGAPLCVPGRGVIAVVGATPVAAALARALALQLCCAVPPHGLQLRGPSDEPWIAEMPHAASGAGRVLTIVHGEQTHVADGECRILVAPVGAAPLADVVIRVFAGAGGVVDVGGARHDAVFEPVSQLQAERISRALRERARAAHGESAVPPDLSALAEVPLELGFDTLPAVVGVAADDVGVLDIVRDGPHAVVIGVTGSGKSEFLITWIASLCQRHTPEQVSFLLVDFKGGSSFDVLRSLPHVVGVVTDLDEAAAVRAIESLRAEVRYRERVLADCGARDVIAAEGVLGRLVIVVDEYAALAGAQPELHDVFADIAARGRSLGMHLILASQRATGVFRDAVLANCPLRVSLRVTDVNDSRTILGTDDAAHLPGNDAGRGIALVRRPADVRPQRVSVVRTSAATVADIAAVAGSTRARAVWLPPLPSLVTSAEMRDAEGIGIALVDHPDEQQRRVATLDGNLVVQGRSASGKTSVLRAIAMQAGALCWLPSELEAAWDALGRLEELSDAVVVMDDVDALLAAFPPEYAAVAAGRIEQAVREARARGNQVVLSITRQGGPVGRICDLIPRRAVLAQASRTDLVAAGETTAFGHDFPPARGIYGGRAAQFATEGERVIGATAHCVPRWRPQGRAGFVAPDGPATRRSLEAYQERGWQILSLTDTSVVGTDSELSRTIIHGPAEQWLSVPSLLATLRAQGSLAVDSRCAAELRMLTGHRELAPFASPGAGRVWVFSEDGLARRQLRCGLVMTQAPGSAESAKLRH